MARTVAPEPGNDAECQLLPPSLEMKIPFSEVAYKIGSAADVNPKDTLVKLAKSGAGKLCNPAALWTATKRFPVMYKVGESRGDFGSIQIRCGTSGRVARDFQLAPQSRDTNNVALRSFSA